MQVSVRVRIGVGLFGLALALCVAGPGWAQVEPSADPAAPAWDDSYYPFARQGAYVGLGGVYAIENFDRDSAVGSLGITGKDGGGIDLRGGFRFHPHFSGEVIFNYFAEFEVSGRNTASDTFDGWSLMGAAKGYALLGAIQPYGLVGLGGLVFMEKRGNDSGFVARMGGGFDLYLTDHLVIEAEATYMLPAGEIDDFQFAIVGGSIIYRF